jgi:hypothetical protein
MRHLRSVVFGVVMAMLIPFSVAPIASAESVPIPIPPTVRPQPAFAGITSGTLTLDQAKAEMAKLPKPTAQQMDIARAMLAKDHFDVSITQTPMPSLGGKGMSAPHTVSVGINWWGYYIYFTQNDIHQIWDIIWAAGIGAGAAILCSEGGPLAVVCAIAGAVIAYIIAEIIWNYIGYYVPSCGVYIEYTFWGSWSWGDC